MSCTVNVLCYKSKTLSNGEHPLMLCVSKDSKRKYIGLGITIHPTNWDFEKNKPRKGCPNRDLVQNLINEKIKLYTECILELNARNKEYSIFTLVEKVNGPSNKTTVGMLLNKQINQLWMEERIKYSSVFGELKASLESYCSDLNIYFSEIDVAWLKKYEAWLCQKGLSGNSISIRMRSLRTLYNMAIENHIVKPEYYPFKAYKISKLQQETAKRALTKEDVQKIISYDTSTKDRYTQLAIDLFTYSYIMGGINFVDMAYLTKGNIFGNHLVYARKKTHKQLKFPLHPIALKLHEKYSGGKYIFPVLSDSHQTALQKANRIHKVIAKVNNALKVVGEELKLPMVLTTYVARHSFATVLKRSGVSTSIISESLGHSSERITQIYLDSFENKQIYKAMENLL